jgi:hypothetical protein
LNKLFLGIALSALSLSLFPQQLSHDVSVINIEVPVRVFKGGAFIDNLTINDFEVYEDGKLQKVEAVYLIKKSSIERKEEKRKFQPQTSRNFVLLFQITEYLPKIGEAMDYFFKNVILPGDSLTLITPLKTYNFKSQSLELLSKEKIIEQLKGKLIKDTKMGNIEYRDLLNELNKALKENTENFDYCRQILDRLESIRWIDEKKILEFANFLKAKEGQKNVYLFYQKEVLPQLPLAKLNEMMSLNQDDPQLIQLLSDLFLFYKRDITFNVDLVKKAFANSSISMHFLFITKAPQIGETDLNPSGLSYVEHSEDVYNAFKEMAQATGGIVQTSANPAFSFQKAVDASENYYLLYYSPEDYRRDGKFRKIEVKVKDKNYSISHRAGYFAN